MQAVTKNVVAGLIASFMALAVQSDAKGQYAVAVQPVTPAVVGYAAERRGLFGRRVVFRPVVGQVPIAPVVTVAQPIFTAPIIAPVTVGYAPVVTQYQAPVPVATYYRAPAPVATYYRAPAPVVTYYRAPAPVLPIRAYRVPVRYGYGF